MQTIYFSAYVFVSFVYQRGKNISGDPLYKVIRNRYGIHICLVSTYSYNIFTESRKKYSYICFLADLCLLEFMPN